MLTTVALVALLAAPASADVPAAPAKAARRHVRPEGWARLHTFRYTFGSSECEETNDLDKAWIVCRSKYWETAGGRGRNLPFDGRTLLVGSVADLRVLEGREPLGIMFDGGPVLIQDYRPATDEHLRLFP